MKKISAVILIFFLVSFRHPFYLSVTDLKYNVKEKALQGSLKIFVNDLEGTLKKIKKQTVDLVNIKDTTETETILKNYLTSHISLKVNGKDRPFDLIGFEREEEALWIYVEFKKCELPKKVELQNTILFEHLSDQTNIVHISVNSIKKSLKATCPDKNFVFEFQ